jgi:hypothetical protein
MSVDRCVVISIKLRELACLATNQRCLHPSTRIFRAIFVPDAGKFCFPQILRWGRHSSAVRAILNARAGTVEQARIHVREMGECSSQNGLVFGWARD